MKKKILALVAIVTVGIGSTLGLFYAFGGFPKGSNQAEADGTSTTVSENKVTDISQYDVQETADEASAQFSGISMTFLDNSMPHRAQDRLWEDSVSTPYKAKDATGIYAETEEEILRNPVEGYMVARGLRKIFKSNTWLSKFIKINKKVMKEGGEGNKYWLCTRGKDTSTLCITDEYRGYAARICLLLRKFKVKGIEKRWTNDHFCLNDNVTSEYVKAIKAKYSEDKDALILTATKKGGKTITIGFNTGDGGGDKRFERFDTAKKKKVTKKSSSRKTAAAAATNNNQQQQQQDDNSSGEDTTTTATKTTEEEVTDTLVEDGEGAKNPDNDPMNQGNATDGDFINDDLTPGAVDYTDNEQEKNAAGLPDPDQDGSMDHPWVDQGGANNAEPATENIPVQQDSHDTADSNIGDSSANTGVAPIPD